MDTVFSSAADLAGAIRAGRASAVEVLEAHLAQIERHNPALNAVVTLDAGRAHERARAADAALARGEVWGPLHGVPFTLKDAHATAGVRTTTGFPPLAGQVPREDGTVAARLKAAGAILVGKTNVATMLGDYQTANPIFGRTNNPWDMSCTPGGSSGGAAAALAAGLTPLDIGTDLSGSIRLPAHFCGVFGLKPTERRVSLDGLIPGLPPPRGVRVMSCVGPLARTPEDLALLYRLIAGPDGRDTEVPPVPLDDAPEVALRDLRIAVVPTFPGIPAAAAIRDAVAALARALERAGAAVEAAAPPALDYHEELRSAGELIGMMVGAAQADEGAAPTTLAQYLTALDRRDQSILAWERFLEAWDVLLCPPSMSTAFPHCEPGTPLRVDGRDVDYWMVCAHATLFNYTGHPALAMPYTQNNDGLPIGVQLVGKRWDEARLLAVAAALSGVAGGFRRPPGY
ncbi:MAG TPA: amidase family protein [Thermomicrobiales bacterium]|nr:amidase family protein [Thermomicrobiales bacterium]